MAWTCIARFPIGHVPKGQTNDFVPATQQPHQDAGFVAVQRTDTKKYRYVDNDGRVEDDRDSAGAGERFVAGVAGTVIAFRPDGDPAGRPFVFPVQ